MESKIQHWLTTVARAAGLEGADELQVSSDTDVEAAWAEVSETTGTDLDALARAVADHFRLNVADLNARDPQAYRLLPGILARGWSVLPLSYTDRSLVVATGDPVSLEMERSIKDVSDRSVVYRVAPPSRIRELVEATYEGQEGQVPDGPPAHGEGTAHVLVVDDDPDIRVLLRTVLERHDYRVSEAENGRAALEIVEGDDPVDFMTLDLRMEEMDGLEVLRALRARPETADLPVIVATGADDPEEEIRLFEAGADDFIVKPLDPHRFMLRMEAVQRRRRRGG